MTPTPRADHAVDARYMFQVWFFRDLSDAQRQSLIGMIMGEGCAKEATNHGIQRHSMRHILKCLADTPEVQILRRALAWHGDPQRMATTREDWQQTIDEAIVWVKSHPEEGRSSFPTLAAAPKPAIAGSKEVREAVAEKASIVDYLRQLSANARRHHADVCRTERDDEVLIAIVTRMETFAFAADQIENEVYRL